MHSILKMCIANIKRKKLQTILISIIIAGSSLVFSTSIGVLGNLDGQIEKMFDKTNASHMLLFPEGNTMDIKDAAAWWRAQDGVKDVILTNQYHLNDKALFKGQKLKSGMRVSEVSKDNFRQDKILIIEGEKKDFPSPSEVWIPVGFADANNMKLGDIIDMPTGDGSLPFKISALVVDPHFASIFMDPTRVWVAPGELSSIFPLSCLNSVSLGVRYSDLSKDAKLWKDFESLLGRPFTGLKMPYEMVSSANSFTYKLIGTILLLLSVIIIVITLFIISFTIASSILSDYKAIGILKSQGFSSSDIVSVYTTHYLIISIISVPVGIATSIKVTAVILSNFLRSIGMATEPVSATYFILVFAILTLVILAAAYINSLKAGKIKPADAIRYGAPSVNTSSKRTISVPFIKNLPVPLILGVKDILSNKRQSLFLGLTVGLCSLVLTFSLNLHYSLMKSVDNYSTWGFEDSDIVITRTGVRFGFTQEDLERRLKTYHEIKNMVSNSFITNCSIINEKANAAESIIAILYGGNFDEIGLVNITGRNPQNDNEVTLAINTSKELQKQVGDTVTLYIDGIKLNMLVTGVYQSTNNTGHGARILMSTMKNINPTFEPQLTQVKLKEGVDVDKFVSILKRRLGTSVEVESIKEEMIYSLTNTISKSGIALSMVSAIFALVCFITIFNSTSISIHRQRRELGVYKSFGMTPGEVRLSIVCRIIVISLLGILCGIPSGIIIGPMILNTLFSVIGIVSYPFVINPVGTLLIIPLCLAIAILSGWIPSTQITKISPRTLIVE